LKVFDYFSLFPNAAVNIEGFRLLFPISQRSG
jgi:hypothetical protein